MFEYKPDYEQSKARIDAFWENELIDRPVVQFYVAKPPEEQAPLPPSNHATPAERWLDRDRRGTATLECRHRCMVTR